MNLRIITSALLPLLLLYASACRAIDIPAVLQFERVVALSVPVSGVVSRVLVEEGQQVSENELLLELEETPFKVQLDKTAAELRLLDAERVSIEKELVRNKELFDRMVLSMVSLENSELAFTRADSLWQAKKAEYELDKYYLQKSRLLAPYSGTIIERAAEPGQTIRTDMQPPVLFRLADVSSFIVEAEVTGDKIGLLSHGTQLEVRIQGEIYAAMVKSSLLLAPGRSMSQPARYLVRVKLNEKKAGFRPGQPATLIVSSKGK